MPQARPRSQDVLAIVRDAVRAMPPSGRYGSRSVFISDVWDRVGRRVGMSLDTFKAWLVHQNQQENLKLARADMVDDMDPRQVNRSETHHLGAQFHFLVDSDARDPWDVGYMGHARENQSGGADMPKKNR